MRQFFLSILFGIFFCASQSASAQIVAAKKAMVVTEHKLASDIGVAILKQGGNAVDAAVAVGYALAVVNPCCGNIGGGGFMLIHFANGKNIFLNFREKAPLRASKNMFLNKSRMSTDGYLAVAVPGTVLGLDTALKKYGTLPREVVMQPAIHLAKFGYTVTPYEARQINEHAKVFSQQPNVAAIFFKNGRPIEAGEKLIQKDLANTLTQIAKKGPDVFYKGYIAQEIVSASEKQGGILSLKDFASYHITESAPLYCSYRGYTLITSSPPTSGGVTLCEILNILENFPLAKWGYRTPQSLHTIIEAMGFGFADRNKYLGDPDFVRNPVSHLLSKQYAGELSRQITNKHTISTEMTPQHELTDTTHYSIVDASGNAVSVTYTLNGFFGAGVIAGQTGFFLNDEMDDFATQPGKENKFSLVQHEPNAIQPGKRPLSSMAPTIVLKNNKLFMVLGSPGGPRIITATLLALLNVIDYNMDIQNAIDAPRFHYQKQPDTVYTEPHTFSDTTFTTLMRMGHRFIPQQTWSAVETIKINTDGSLLGANDYRRPDGKASGY